MVPVAQTHMPCMHPDTCFGNGPCATMKSYETTPNMSFGPKVVDWACSLRKKRNGSSGINWCLVWRPIPIFVLGHARLRNDTKPPQTWALDQKQWIGYFRCEKRRNDTSGINWCLVWRPIPVFIMGHMWQRNGMKPPQTWVVDLSIGLGMFVGKKQKMVLVAQTLAFFAPRYPFSQWVTCGEEMTQNNSKQEFWT